MPLFKPSPDVSKFRDYMNLFMMLLYCVTGLMFLFTNVLIETFPGYRKEIGGTLVAYSIVRSILFVRKIKRERSE